MRHARADILLLTSGRNVYALISKDFDISTDGAQTTTKDFNKAEYKERIDELLNIAKKRSPLVKKNLQNPSEEVINR